MVKAFAAVQFELSVERAARQHEQAVVAEKEAFIAELEALIEKLEGQVQECRRTKFGPKSEKLDPAQLELALEDLETAIADASRAHRSIGTVSAQGSTGWVLIRRRNSSFRRSVAFVVRAAFHCDGSRRVKVNSRSPASSRLSATARHFSRHLRRKALRRFSTSAAVSA